MLPVPHLAIVQADLADLCRHHRVLRLFLFGSILRADFGPESDIDMLVEFEPQASVTYFDLVDLQDDLTALLGRRVDLGTPAALSPYIRDAVLASARVLYQQGAR